jgi:hypothetical protein
MSCFQKGATVWDTGLRRVVKIKSLNHNSDWAMYDYALYSVESHAAKDDCSRESESTCCELRSLDPKTEVGRHNLRIVQKIEKLLGALR